MSRVALIIKTAHLSVCGVLHVLFLLKHHLNLRKSPSVTEDRFSLFPIITSKIMIRINICS